MGFQLVSITTTDQVSRALSLCARACQFHPDAFCRVYVVTNDFDTVWARACEADRVEVLPVPEHRLGATVVDLARLYTAAELCCLCKPAIMLDALERSDTDVIYVDSDIYLYDRLDPALDRLREGQMLLTPHLYKPLPSDGREPSELTILRGGIFNAGFVGVRTGAEAPLEWWLNHLRQACYIDYARMLNADQKWLDLLPTLFEGIIVSDHPGINAGYWTMAQLDLLDGKPPTIGGAPVVAFHFSGLDAASPVSISKHQTRRLPVAEFEVLAQAYLRGCEEFVRHNRPTDLTFRRSRVRRTMQWLSDTLWRIHDGLLRRWPR